MPAHVPGASIGRSKLNTVTAGSTKANRRKAFWISLLASLTALLLLAVLDVVVSSGWRYFVLGKLFKAGWAVTVALGAGTLAAAALDLLGSEGDRTEPQRRPLAAAALQWIVATVTALVALGYLLPDWDPWTVGLSAVVLVIWAGALGVSRALR